MRTKIRIILGVFLILFSGLIARLFYWQIIKSGSLSIAAQAQYNSSEITSAPRGNILASDGSFWVIRANAWKVIANTNEIVESPRNLALRLAPLLTLDATDSASIASETDNIENTLDKKGVYIPVAQKIPDDVKKNIEAMKITGLSFESQEDRYYPEASSAAQLLGFVGKDENGNNLGYFGLEGYYNLALSGKPGFTGGERDARGAPILLDGTTQVSAISGVDLATNIDKRIQILAEEKLNDAITKYGAKGGSITIMDPNSGNILAMASLPSFDPRKYWQYQNSDFKNPVISNSFEPGSIFKPIVMAAGIDAGVVKPDTKCDICSGPLSLDNYQIETWNQEYHPDESMTDVIVNSDNVGMSFVGEKLGQDRLYDYLNKFGIGRLTGIDLQGEIAPDMRKRGTWNSIDQATTTFGQGIAVTGIQMVRAISAIANGGYLVTPKVVSSIQGDGWENNIKSTTSVRIISSDAAKEATQMMVEAANRGEAKWTKIPGFNIAGKTGTAQIPVAGHYDPTNTNHSFIGFAPAVNPKFVMLVTLDSPTSSPWAAETAAPAWYSVAKDLFPYMGIQPDE